MTTRRHFLQASTAAGLAASALAAQNQPEKKPSPNDRIRVALIGAGGMGSSDAESSQQVPGVELVAVSDIYQGRLTRAKSAGAISFSLREIIAKCWPARISMP